MKRESVAPSWRLYSTVCSFVKGQDASVPAIDWERWRVCLWRPVYFAFSQISTSTLLTENRSIPQTPFCHYRIDSCISRGSHDHCKSEERNKQPLMQARRSPARHIPSRKECHHRSSILLSLGNLIDDPSCMHLPQTTLFWYTASLDVKCMLRQTEVCICPLPRHACMVFIFLTILTRHGTAEMQNGNVGVC
jgi:hypothetical protein